MAIRGILVLLISAFLMTACGNDDTKNKSKKSDAPTVAREAVLPASKAQELLSGNTLRATRHGKDRSIRIYHGKNGTVQSLDGKEKTGKWRVKEDGQYCLEWEGKPEACRFIANDGKGGFLVVDNAYKVVWTVNKFSPGKK